MDTQSQYDTYWGKKGFNPSWENERAIKLLSPFIKNNTKILDIGCGSGGTYANHFIKAKRGVWTGIDISEKALKSAMHSRKYKVDLNKQLPELDEFDLIICLEVLEHTLYPADVVGYIDRHLSKDGVAIITVPNSYSWLFRVKYLLGKNEAQGFPREFGPAWQDPHIRYLNKTSFEKLLAGAFKDRRISVSSYEPAGYKGISSPLDKVYPSLFSANFIAIIRPNVMSAKNEVGSDKR
jgi:SAM-dependent methyltransferase